MPVPAPQSFSSRKSNRKVPLLVKARSLIVAVTCVGSFFAGVAQEKPSIPIVPKIPQQTALKHIVHRVAPVTPALARSLSAGGHVKLETIVSPEGSVLDVKPISGNPVLVGAAVDAVKQWRFRPFMVNGKPSKITTLIDVAFSVPTIPKVPVTEKQLAAVKLAIEDEIYDYGFQGKYDLIGVGIGSTGTKVPIYIAPTLENGHGWLIYKLMPYGEVFREYRVREDGFVVFPNDPERGFPPTQPSTSTLYMQDDVVCRFKQQWKRAYFEVQFKPDKARVKQASERQKNRVGFSAQESEDAGQK